MPAPTNDLCAGAIEITSLPFTDTVDVSDATHDHPGVPCVGWDPWTERTIWYKWTAPSNNPVVLELTDSQTWGPQIVVYTGTCGALTNVACSLSNKLRFTPTAGVTYYIMLATWEEAPTPISFTFTLRLPIVLSAPVLTVTSANTSRNLLLSWTASTPTPNLGYAVERCAGAGCSGFTTIVTLSGTSYTDRGLTDGTTYRYRVRALHSIEDNSAYSNIGQGTTEPGSVGVVQYACAYGIVGGLSRMGHFSQSSPLTSGNPLVVLTSVLATHASAASIFGLWTHPDNQRTTQPGGPGTPLYTHYDLVLSWVEGTGTVFSTAHTAVTVGQPFVGGVLAQVGPLNLTQSQYYSVNQKIEIRGRLGSADLLTGTHAPDGYLEVRLNGLVVIRVDNIPLGRNGAPGWNGVIVNPAGATGTMAPDGSGIVQNGGARSFYLKSVDEYGHPGDIYDYDFDVVVKEDLFTRYNASNPWVGRRWAEPGSVSPYVPTLYDLENGDGQRLVDSDPAVGFTLSYMHPRVAPNPPALGSASPRVTWLALETPSVGEGPRPKVSWVELQVTRAAPRVTWIEVSVPTTKGRVGDVEFEAPGHRTPNLKPVDHLKWTKTTPAGVRNSWSLHTSLSARALCSCLFSDNIDDNAPRSLRLKPFIGLFVPAALIHKCDTGVTDDGTLYEGVIRTKPRGDLLQKHGIRAATLMAESAPGVSVGVTLIRDHGREQQTVEVDLTPPSTEPRVISPLDNSAQSENYVAQVQLGDPDGPREDNWVLDALALQLREEESA